MDLAQIKQLAFETMSNRRSRPGTEKGNKYYHGERVANLVVTLRKQVLPDDSSSDEILIVAAWFHDIMNGVDNHAHEGAKKTREILTDYCTQKELDEICNIIDVHDLRRPGDNSYSDYQRLQQDADLLDHFGTFDIWMSFHYAAHIDQSIPDIIDWFNTTRSNDEFKYRKWLNFDISKKIYDEKSAFVRSFAERLAVEGTGGIWNSELLFR